MLSGAAVRARRLSFVRARPAASHRPTVTHAAQVALLALICAKLGRPRAAVGTREVEGREGSVCFAVLISASAQLPTVIPGRTYTSLDFTYEISSDAREGIVPSQFFNEARSIAYRLPSRAPRGAMSGRSAHTRSPEDTCKSERALALTGRPRAGKNTLVRQREHE